MTNLKTHMYDWVMNYNPFTSMWQAARREDMIALYTDRTKLIESSSLLTLIDILNRTDGRDEEINKLISHDGDDV